MTTHEVLPSSAVLRYCSADVNMHTGYPCADKTRPRLRRTYTLSSTMSTTEGDIDMEKGELDRLQDAAGCACSSTGADRRGGYQRPRCASCCDRPSTCPSTPPRGGAEASRFPGVD